MNIKPLGDRVVIEPVEKKDAGKTKTGLFLPETMRNEEQEEGKVIEVGPGKRSDSGAIIPMHVKKGDRVIFYKSYGVKEIKINDKECLIVREDDILGIIG